MDVGDVGDDKRAAAQPCRKLSSLENSEERGHEEGEEAVDDDVSGGAKLIQRLPRRRAHSVRAGNVPPERFDRRRRK